MNKCVERLYNGIIKENPTFHNSRTDVFQPADLRTA